MPDIEQFRMLVRREGAERYRDLPWRRTRDPYGIWLSEVMLQQTQVARVLTRWPEWLERFPTVESLAAAPTSEVLAAWQGMGYNRRALALKAAAEEVTRDRDGVFPQDADELKALPGIGPATAAGIRAFAFDLPGVYLETNVRTVFLHELYPSAESVPDRELVPLVRDTCPPDASDPKDDPRTWYYALLDYGAYLKRTVPNPSRRSSSHVRQSRFEGSHRQKRAALLRVLLAHGSSGVDIATVCEELGKEEAGAGRSPLGEKDVRSLLEELSVEGFCRQERGVWIV